MKPVETWIAATSDATPTLQTDTIYTTLSDNNNNNNTGDFGLWRKLERPTIQYNDD